MNNAILLLLYAKSRIHKLCVHEAIIQGYTVDMGPPRPSSLFFLRVKLNFDGSYMIGENWGGVTRVCKGTFLRNYLNLIGTFDTNEAPY